LLPPGVNLKTHQHNLKRDDKESFDRGNWETMKICSDKAEAGLKKKKKERKG